MSSFSSPAYVRWSDLDPSFHLRHSAYYELCAQARVEFLYRHQMDSRFMIAHHIAPIILREEAVFKKEVRPEDKVIIETTMFNSKKDYSRFGMRHHIIKNDDTLSAIVTLDLAWMDTLARKIAKNLPEEVMDAFEKIERSDDFAWF